MPVLVLPLSRRRVFNVGPAIWQHLRYSPALSIPRRTFASTQDQPVLEDADTTTLKYTLHIAPSTSPQVPTVRVVCIADTHNLQDRISLPPGDILIHAGDLTNWGTESELSNALKWLSSLPYPHKVFVAGNHDHALAIPERRDALLASFPDLIYLEDSSVTLTVNGHPLKLFGSPRTPKRGEGVFQYLIRSTEWPIPPDTDIVITHGPPKFHLDDGGQGCNFLLAALWRIRPPLHVFGHIHDGRGVAHLDWSRNQRHYE
ncbi:Metallo-dependent phosphatase, partial [Trametes sanguinea]